MIEIIFVFAIAFFTIVACEEASLNKEYNIVDFSSDHARQVWDSTSTANQLQGSWQWVYSECCVEGTLGGVDRTGEEFIVRIDLTTIQVYQKNELVKSTDWFLEIEDGNYYGINTQSYISEIRGRILFSGNRILFQNSYIDGADNYFVRHTVKD